MPASIHFLPDLFIVITFPRRLHGLFGRGVSGGFI